MNGWPVLTDAKTIINEENKEERYYIELRDGYRLVYERGKYVGRYNPNLNEVI